MRTIERQTDTKEARQQEDRQMIGEREDREMDRDRKKNRQRDRWRMTGRMMDIGTIERQTNRNMKAETQTDRDISKTERQAEGQNEKERLINRMMDS